MDFHLGSAFAGVYQVGNYGARPALPRRPLRHRHREAVAGLAVHAGRLSTFEGQRDAAIREHEAGLTLVNVTFANTPVGIEIDPRLRRLALRPGRALRATSRQRASSSRTRTTPTRRSASTTRSATGTPVFARFRESGRTVGRTGPIYRGQGVQLRPDAAGRRRDGPLRHALRPRPLASLPAPGRRRSARCRRSIEWTDVRSARRQGRRQDRRHRRAAGGDRRAPGRSISRAASTSVSDTIAAEAGHGADRRCTRARPSSSWPIGTPAFQGVGAPKALIEGAAGRRCNIVSGLGLVHRRHQSARDRAAVEGGRDVARRRRQDPGRRTARPLANGTRFDPYNADHSRRHRSARALGRAVSEHLGDRRRRRHVRRHLEPEHLRAGGLLRVGHEDARPRRTSCRSSITCATRSSSNRVENWEFLAPQTEEEVGESPNAVSLEIRNSRNISIANYHGYRVTRTLRAGAGGGAALRRPATSVSATSTSTPRAASRPATARAAPRSCALSKFPYENAIVDVTHGLEVREREFAVLDVPRARRQLPRSLRQGAGGHEARRRLLLDRRAARSDADGTLYFVDRHSSASTAGSPRTGLTIVSATPRSIRSTSRSTRSGNLLVLSSDGPEGTVYSFKPGRPRNGRSTVIAPTPADAHRGRALAVPVNWWDNGEFKDQLDPTRRRFTTLAEMFARGHGDARSRANMSRPTAASSCRHSACSSRARPTIGGWRFSDSLDTYGFIAAKPGDARVRHQRLREPDLQRPCRRRRRAHRSAASSPSAAARASRPAPTGASTSPTARSSSTARTAQEVGRIDVPERPLQLLFGGQDRRTLFILTHHALYSALPECFRRGSNHDE